jgi:hypothetical protein
VGGDPSKLIWKNGPRDVSRYDSDGYGYGVFEDGVGRV